MTQKAKQNKQTQQELLEELESIKNLLDDDMENIPLLEELVEEPPKPTEPNTVQKTAPDGSDTNLETGAESQSHRQPAPKPHDPHPPSPTATQKSHFSLPSRNRPTSENPFLPKHIRERLNGAVGLPGHEMPDTQPPSVIAPTAEATTTLVDQLVAQYLPIIEAELRRKLHNKLQGK